MTKKDKEDLDKYDEIMAKRRERIGKRGPSKFSLRLMEQAKKEKDPYIKLILMHQSAMYAESDDFVITDLK